MIEIELYNWIDKLLIISTRISYNRDFIGWEWKWKEWGIHDWQACSPGPLAPLHWWSDTKIVTYFLASLVSQISWTAGNIRKELYMDQMHHNYRQSYTPLVLLIKPIVILPLIKDGSFLMSAMAAIGIPQLATDCSQHTMD